MLLFIDTEFTSFENCELMSFGAVSEDGKYEFYQEVNDYTLEHRSQFVVDNIVPLLDRSKYGRSYEATSRELSDWINSLPCESITVIVDYIKDAQFMQDMVSKYSSTKPISFQFINAAVVNIMDERGITSLPRKQKAGQLLHIGMEEYFTIDSRRHHALVDAKSNRHGWIKALNTPL